LRSFFTCVFMRESVLLALIHIFAIISTVNPAGISSRGKKIIRNYLRKYLNPELEEEYYALFENDIKFYSIELENMDKAKLSDQDSLISFQITNICRQIRKGLFLEERMIVFLQLLEYISEDGMISEQEKIIIDIVAKTFNIPKKEYENALAFMIGRTYDELSPDCMLIIESDKPELWAQKEFINYDKWQHIRIKGFEGNLFILHIESTGSLIMIYDGKMNLHIKGLDIFPCRPYFLERGVNIKGQGIEPIYYSKIYKKFVSSKFPETIYFEGHNIEFIFRNSDNGIHDMSFRIESGNLVGLMGGSGAGKTTLINILNGKIKPSTGNLYINGYDIHADSEKLNGLIGFVPQDDMLIEELTVYQNLYFNARLCFGDYDKEQLNVVVEKVLYDLDLYEIKDLQVGDPLNKKISGGQRKRLNIGLELMREPVVLFIDEPTSGLSSLDSEKMMFLLKKQALRGKLVFAIVHQPSSSILRMFDRLWILDKGGYMIYDEDPVETLVYFKTETSQVNAAESECPNCGNIETDDILNIIEAKVIDNSGHEGKERQVSPVEWYEKYKKKMMPVLKERPEKLYIPPSDFRVPKKSEQVKTFIKRNITQKLADRQYMTINLLEAPLLALILSFISKYSENKTYVFAENQNYHIFLFMAVIVALFIGLTVSAWEIFRDRKILEREKYLNISRESYLLSKITFLFGLSALQSLAFVLVSNYLLEIKGMLLQQWMILFSTACFGNLLGLNVSSGMKTADSIYILIPLLLVPMLILGGAMIRFDDLHKSMTNKIYVPMIGDAMVTRWAYEAIMVENFKNNEFEKPFFKYDMEISLNSWKASFLIPALKVKVEECRAVGKNQIYREHSERNIKKIKYHINELYETSGIKPGDWFNDLDYNKFNDSTAYNSKSFLDSLMTYIRIKTRTLTLQRDSLYKNLEELMGTDQFIRFRDMNYNKNLANVVLNRFNTLKIYDSDKKLVQKADPIFMKPDSKYGRAHFYAPYKQVGNFKIDTLFFNTFAIWIMIVFLFVTLYYDVLKHFIIFLENLNIPVGGTFRKELLRI